MTFVVMLSEFLLFLCAFFLLLFPLGFSFLVVRLLSTARFFRSNAVHPLSGRILFIRPRSNTVQLLLACSWLFLSLFVFSLCPSVCPFFSLFLRLPVSFLFSLVSVLLLFFSLIFYLFYLSFHKCLPISPCLFPFVYLSVFFSFPCLSVCPFLSVFFLHLPASFLYVLFFSLFLPRVFLYPLSIHLLSFSTFSCFFAYFPSIVYLSLTFNMSVSFPSNTQELKTSSSPLPSIAFFFFLQLHRSLISLCLASSFFSLVRAQLASLLSRSTPTYPTVLFDEHFRVYTDTFLFYFRSLAATAAGLLSVVPPFLLSFPTPTVYAQPRRNSPPFSSFFPLLSPFFPFFPAPPPSVDFHSVSSTTLCLYWQHSSFLSHEHTAHKIANASLFFFASDVWFCVVRCSLVDRFSNHLTVEQTPSQRG